MNHLMAIFLFCAMVSQILAVPQVSSTPKSKLTKPPVPDLKANNSNSEKITKTELENNNTAEDTEPKNTQSLVFFPIVVKPNGERKLIPISEAKEEEFILLSNYLSEMLENNPIEAKEAKYGMFLVPIVGGAVIAAAASILG